MKKFAKILTQTDVGSNGSHQGGPLIPLSVQGILPQPVVSNYAVLPSASTEVTVDVSRNGSLVGTVDAAVIAHSRGFQRDDETHFTGSFTSLANAKAGDVMVVSKSPGRRRFAVNIISKRNAKSVKTQLGGKRYGILS